LEGWQSYCNDCQPNPECFEVSNSNTNKDTDANTECNRDSSAKWIANR
jgi:hypothetical protein